MFGSERLTGALLDRLTHHVDILEMNGDSYRLKHSRKSNQPRVRGRLELCSRVPVLTEKDLRHSFSRQRKG